MHRLLDLKSDDLFVLHYLAWRGSVVCLTSYVPVINQSNILLAFRCKSPVPWNWGIPSPHFGR
jgi:hypothetical protein